MSAPKAEFKIWELDASMSFVESDRIDWRLDHNGVLVERGSAASLEEALSDMGNATVGIIDQKILEFAELAISRMSAKGAPWTPKGASCD